ncbi:hypothetical protein ACE6H2_022678 [Prunus campanulata]
MASGATCVQRLDGSRDSAIHTKYRISLRSSSMREPRYPLPRVVLTYLKMTTPPARTVSGATGTRSLIQVPWRNSRRCSFVRTEGSVARTQRKPPEIKGQGAARPLIPRFETSSRVVLLGRFRQ